MAFFFRLHALDIIQSLKHARILEDVFRETKISIARRYLRVNLQEKGKNITLGCKTKLRRRALQTHYKKHQRNKIAKLAKNTSFAILLFIFDEWKIIPIGKNI